MNRLHEKTMLLLQRIDALKGKKVQEYHFDGIEKWYKPPIISDLSMIRLCIMKEPDLKYRRFSRSHIQKLFSISEPPRM